MPAWVLPVIGGMGLVSLLSIGATAFVCIKLRKQPEELKIEFDSVKSRPNESETRPDLSKGSGNNGPSPDNSSQVQAILKKELTDR